MRWEVTEDLHSKTKEVIAVKHITSCSNGESVA